jgi:hypothetical protein
VRAARTTVDKNAPASYPGGTETRLFAEVDEVIQDRRRASAQNANARPVTRGYCVRKLRESRGSLG